MLTPSPFRSPVPQSSFSKRFNLILADLASLETRDLSSSSKRSPLKANVVIPSVVAVTSAAAIAAASFWSWRKNGGKEAIDGFWESDEGKAFVSKLAGLEKREAGDEETLKLLGF